MWQWSTTFGRSHMDTRSLQRWGACGCGHHARMSPCQLARCTPDKYKVWAQTVLSPWHALRPAGSVQGATVPALLHHPVQLEARGVQTACCSGRGTGGMHTEGFLVHQWHICPQALDACCTSGIDLGCNTTIRGAGASQNMATACSIYKHKRASCTHEARQHGMAHFHHAGIHRSCASALCAIGPPADIRWRVAVWQPAMQLGRAAAGPPALLACIPSGCTCAAAKGGAGATACGAGMV